MQMVVVAVTLPSLLLMNRTRAYPFLRIAGALVAGAASVGWIAERLLAVHSSVDVVVNTVGHHAVWIAGVLFLASLSCWQLLNIVDRRPSDPLGAATLRPHAETNFE